MNSRLIALVALIALGLGLGAVSIVRASGTPEPSPGLHYDVQFHDTIIAKVQTGLSQGDQFVLNDTLLSNGAEVGHNGGVCTVNDAAGELICVVTWSLPDGTISTQFLNTPPPDKVFAITGGTGAYAGIQGTGELTENGDETGSVTFHPGD
jgi:hypothetical protein